MKIKKYICVLLMAIMLIVCDMANGYCSDECKLKKKPAESKKKITKVEDLYYKGIIPGVTTEKEARRLIGNFTQSETKWKGETYYILGTNNIFNENNFILVAKRGKVDQFEIYFSSTNEVNISDIKKILGEPGASRFSSRFKVYAYPEYGMIFVFNKDSGKIKNIKFFEKTDLKTFEKKYGAFPMMPPYTH